MERNWVENLYSEVIENIIRKKGEDKIFEADIRKIINKTFPYIIATTEKFIKKQSKIVFNEKRKEIQDFRKRLYLRWQKPLDLLEIFIAYNLEHGIIISDSFRKKGKNIKFETLLRLHARACQISSEILELLKGEFADGALARWRTLYEISIFGACLRNGSEELSQKYLDFYLVESHYEMLEFQKNYKRLRERPLTQKQLDKMSKTIDSLKTKYGKDFVKPYGWASDFLPADKRNFVGLEAYVFSTHMRPYYKWANNYIHGGPKGILFKAGTYRQEKVMLAGPSNYGLADPGKNTAYSLFQTTLTLVGFETYLEDALFIKIAENMVKEIGLEFIKVQKQIEKEERSK